MNLAEDIKPISYVKANAAEIIANIGETKRSLIITQNGEAKAVLTDIETYQKDRETMAMLKMVAIARDDVRQGRTTPHAQVKVRLRKFLKDKLAQTK